jgi:3',5'-cyclic AMP phosphodiesterase CpdA
MEPVRIAHISDLHFGGADNQKDAWDVLADFLQNKIKPDLVLVTGDIVNTPKTKLYEEARQALDGLCKNVQNKPEVRYLVCPGNHDRWRFGNAPFLAKNRGLRRWLARPFRNRITKAASEFDRIFQGNIACLEELDLPLGTKENRWNLRILGIDSSINADASARGFIKQDDVDALRNVMKDSDGIDLAILLVHHHLFPVRSLEKEREGNFWNLVDLTPLVNAGSLVEALASAHIDVALHGHEHASNWGRYATLESEGGETNVIGAASATGSITLKLCELDKVSFNLIELRGDRTVHLTVYRCEGKSSCEAENSDLKPSVPWSIERQLELYDSQALRRARFLRRSQHHIHRNPVSDVTRFIDFTRDRDGIVSETRTNIDFSKDPRIALRAENSTGIPVDLKISLVASDGGSWEPESQVTFRSTSKQGVFDFECPVPENISKTLRHLEFSYRWFGGALLTREEVDALMPGTEGEFRTEGFEFGAISIDSYFNTLRLIVRLPPEFAPASHEIQAYVRNPKLERTDDVLDQPDVINCFRPIGAGLYSLVVPYPRKGLVYGIKWRPPEADSTGTPREGAGHQFADACATRGEKLAKIFHSGLEKTPLANHCSISLYTPAAENANLLRLMGVYPAGTAVPAQIRTGREAMPVTQAWRGVPTIVPEPPDPSPDAWWDLGFMPQEKALMAIPVRFGIGWTNVAPWGVVRIGVNETDSDIQAILEAPNGTLLLNRLMLPMILMLSEVRIGAE